MSRPLTPLTQLLPSASSVRSRARDAFDRGEESAFCRHAQSFCISKDEETARGRTRPCRIVEAGEQQPQSGYDIAALMTSTP